MKTELGLAGNKLLVFAIIYGFCQDEESEYCAGVKYISEWVGCSYKNAIYILKYLLDNGLISKREVITEKCRFVNYRVIKKSNDGLLNNLTTPIKKLNNPPIKKLNTEIENIINNINNNKIKEKIIEWVEYKKEKKESYTPIGLKKCIEKLERLSNNNPDLAMRIVDESISNKWSGLFPLKNNKTKAQTTDERNWEIIKDTFGLEEK